MGIKASIDIGSNSILFLLAEVNGKKISILENESNVTGLGRDLDRNGVFIQEALDDSYSVFKKYKELCDKHSIDTTKVIVTATEASRVAKNAPDFFAKIKSEMGFNVQIISGKGESFYSTKGVLIDENINERFITIMDIGGASTELMKVDTETHEIIHTFSMPMGAVRINNWIETNCENKKMNEIFFNFKESLKKVHTSKLYCVAGTMTSVGNMYLGHKKFIEQEVHGLEFKAREVKKLLENYSEFSAENFLEQFPFLGKRSKTIRAGLILASSIFDILQVEELYISTYGLRYGTLLSDEVLDEFIVRK